MICFPESIVVCLGDNRGYGLEDRVELGHSQFCKMW